MDVAGAALEAKKCIDNSMMQSKEKMIVLGL